MENNLDLIWALVLQVRTLVGSPVRWLTVAIDDDTKFTNDDTTMWNVAIGNQGTATFTVAEAKAPTDAIIRRMAASCLGFALDNPEEVQKTSDELKAKLALVSEQQTALDAEKARLLALQTVVDSIVVKS